MRRTSPITMIVDAISLMPLMYARSRKELITDHTDFPEEDDVTFVSSSRVEMQKARLK